MIFDMIFENITYRENLPFEVSFLNVGDESKHCHKEMEILLVLRGTAHYQIYHTDYELNPGDLIIADLEDLHQIHNSSDDVLLLSLHVDTKQFEDRFPNIRYMFFVCEECMAGPMGNKQLLQSKLSLLKHQIAKLTIDSMKSNKDIPLLQSDVNDLISILVNHFQGFFMEDYQYKTSQENLNPVDLQRLSRITRFILLNYSEKITLEDVANMEHLNSFYISHLIKKTLGFNFQNFVNAIRLEFAEKLLVFSNLTLMQISQECGFSSPNYFNKCFSAWHGKTPAEYRKSYHPCDRSYRTSFSESEALSLLSLYLNVSGSADSLIESGQSQIRVNLELYGKEMVDFKEIHGPTIILRAMNELLKPGEFDEKMKAIHPVELVLRKTERDGSSATSETTPNNISGGTPAPVASFADAFSKIFTTSNLNVDLFGSGRALFTDKGIPTSYYGAYCYMAGLDTPKVSAHPNYAFIKSRDALIFFIYNTSEHALLSAHLETTGLPPLFFLIRTEIGENDSCCEILEALGSPSPIPKRLKENLMYHMPGKTIYSSVIKKETPVLNFSVPPGSAFILEIISPE